VLRLGSAQDDPQSGYQLLHQACDQQVDLIVTSAGVSVGAFDYVSPGDRGPRQLISGV
jgi:molybdopterin biosynthesis enzyme